MTDAESIDQFGALLADTAHAWRNKLDQRLKPLGLSQAKWRVLWHLWREGDGLVQRVLAERVGIEGPSLVRLLDRMTADGWIERRDSPSDRRSKTVHLTDKASCTTRTMEAVARKLRHELLADIPADELRCCMQVLRRISGKAEQLNAS